MDISKEDIPNEFNNSDYGILMFVLSAVVPEYHETILIKVYNAMNKGGVLYFRDYARYDMNQVRFSKKGKNKIDNNLYIRHDKTLAYYFDKEEFEELAIKVGFKIIESKLITRVFENRKDNKVMHRLWLQIKLKKI